MKLSYNDFTYSLDGGSFALTDPNGKVKLFKVVDDRVCGADGSYISGFEPWFYSLVVSYMKSNCRNVTIGCRVFSWDGTVMFSGSDHYVPFGKESWKIVNSNGSIGKFVGWELKRDLGYAKIVTSMDLIEK